MFVENEVKDVIIGLRKHELESLIIHDGFLAHLRHVLVHFGKLIISACFLK